eukprot:Gb_07337 [translate_table: standard]
MARINKFATQNLNDIYGKKEPRPTPADNGNPTGSRPRGSTHGGMLVLTRPVKPQPVAAVKDGKSLAGLTSSLALKKESVQGPVSLITPSNQNETKPQPEPDCAGSNPGKDKSETLPVENSKVESDAISLRPLGRPDVYTPPAARASQAVSQRPTAVENAVVCQEKTETPHPSELPLQTPPLVLKESEPKEEKSEQVAKETVADGMLQPTVEQKPAKPEPFRPPHMRGNAQAAILGKPEGETGHASMVRANRDDQSVGRRENRNNFHELGVKDERVGQEGRYNREGPTRRYEREERMSNLGSGGSVYYYREGNSRPSSGGRAYDIEIISRPGSGGSDYVRDQHSSRDLAYGGRQSFERQMGGNLSYGPDNAYGEGHANRDSYEYRQEFNRQDGAYRRNNNYNNNQFRSGGMTRDSSNRDGYGGRGAGFRRETIGRNNQYGPGQYRDNYGQVPANGRFKGKPREREGNFGQYSRTHRDAHGGNFRYNDPARGLNVGYGGDLGPRPRSGGYEGISPRPSSGGYGSISMGSSDSIKGGHSFYDGCRSPISQDHMVHEEFASRPQGRYQYEGSFLRASEYQGSDFRNQRPRSGGYRGNVGGRSMASSDSMISRTNLSNGYRSSSSHEKRAHEEFSSRAQESYHFEGSFPRGSEVQISDFGADRRLDNSKDSFNGFDSHRPRQEFYETEHKLDDECQKMGWDIPTEYNRPNVEFLKKAGQNNFVPPTEDRSVKSNQKLEGEQRVFGEDKKQYFLEEQQNLENAGKNFVELDDEMAKSESQRKRWAEGLEQEMSKEVAEHTGNEELMGESVEQNVEIHGHMEHGASGNIREELNLRNKDAPLEPQDMLADRLASSKILSSPTPFPVQKDSAFDMRSPNHHSGRGLSQETNSYVPRSSSTSWRREPHEIRNGPSNRFSRPSSEYNYRSQSRESSSSERYQLL